MRLRYIPDAHDTAHRHLCNWSSISESRLMENNAVVREGAEVNVCLQSDGQWHIDDDEMGFPTSDAACDWARQHIGPYVAIRIMHPSSIT